MWWLYHHSKSQQLIDPRISAQAKNLADFYLKNCIWNTTPLYGALWLGKDNIYNLPLSKKNENEIINKGFFALD
jgi:hypothetical protein